MIRMKLSFFQITSNTKTFIIDSCYRPPNGDYNFFQSFIDENLRQIISNNMDIILCGDFNLNLLKVEFTWLITEFNPVMDNSWYQSSEFFYAMNSLSVLPVITKPDRIAGDS